MVGGEMNNQEVREEIVKLLGEKHKLTAILNDEGEEHFTVPHWFKKGENYKYDEIADSLTELVASEGDVSKVFDKFYQIPRGETNMGVMMNVSLKDKIMSALRKEFVLLKRRKE